MFPSAAKVMQVLNFLAPAACFYENVLSVSERSKGPSGGWMRPAIEVTWLMDRQTLSPPNDSQYIYIYMQQYPPSSWAVGEAYT